MRKLCVSHSIFLTRSYDICPNYFFFNFKIAIVSIRRSIMYVNDSASSLFSFAFIEINRLWWTLHTAKYFTACWQLSGVNWYRLGGYVLSLKTIYFELFSLLSIICLTYSKLFDLFNGPNGKFMRFRLKIWCWKICCWYFRNDENKYMLTEERWIGIEISTWSGKLLTRKFEMFDEDT